MIGWIYSDPLHTGFVTGVTRGRQNFLEGAKIFLEGAKTIVGASNRPRVLTDVPCDDFMQLEGPLGVARVPSRLAASLPVIEPRSAFGLGSDICLPDICDLKI